MSEEVDGSKVVEVRFPVTLEVKGFVGGSEDLLRELVETVLCLAIGCSEFSEFPLSYRDPISGSRETAEVSLRLLPRPFVFGIEDLLLEELVNLPMAKRNPTETAEPIKPTLKSSFVIL